MSRMPHTIGQFSEGDTVQLSQKGWEYLTGLSHSYSIKRDDQFQLLHDGTPSCPWYIQTKEGRVFINPESHIQPHVKERMVETYKYIVLNQPVDGLEVGMHYEVKSININGSFIVEKHYTNKIVSQDKCHPWVQQGTKMVPCRCREYMGIVTIEPDSDKGLTAVNTPKPFQVLPMTPDTKKAIKKQREVAREILTFCMIMDHKAFIAGGAPRNWHLNMLAKDLDIFLRAPNGAGEKHMTNVLEAFGVTDLFNLSTHTSPGVRRNSRAQETQALNTHEATSKISYVLQGNYCGEEVQFIVVESNTCMGLGYTRTYFDTSINMILTQIDNDGNLSDKMSVEFTDSMTTGVIFVQENGNPYGDNRHLEKVHGYFPEAPLVPMDYRSIVVKDPRKAQDYAQDWEDFNN